MDEVFYAQAGLSMFEGYMFGNPTHMHAPLAKYFIGLGQVLFGVSEIAIRTPITIFGLLTIVATYLVGRYVFNRTTGAISAILIAAIPEYNYYATMAMLDVPLALFVLCSFGTTVWWLRGTQNRRPTVVLGVLTVLAGATKVQGAVYVIGNLFIVGWILTAERRDRWIEILIAFGVATVGAFALVYLPFAFSPAPTYYGGADPPQFAKTLFSFPWVGSVAFAFAASVVHNLSHLSNGHRVIVAGQTYFHPPAWVLLFWIAKYGGIPYLVGLVTSVASIFGRAGDRGVRIGFTGLLFVPLLIHAGLSVKLSRYLVPLYPVLAVAAGFGMNLIATTAVQYASKYRALLRFSSRNVAAATIAALLILSLVPPSFGATVADDSIRTDSGIDVGASAIIKHAETHGEGTAIVSNPLVYRWYMGEHRVGRFTKDVHRPKSFRPEGTRITLVGTKHAQMKDVLDRESLCIVSVSQSWLEKRDGSNAVYRYTQDAKLVRSHSRVRVFNNCTNGS